MKIKTIRIFPKKLSLKAITVILSSLVLAFSFYSCSDDEALSEDSPYSVIDSSISLLISSSNISALSVTRGLEDDKYAEEGEFINSLCVFICDEEGKILDKRCSDDEDMFSSDENNQASSGNLEEWTWEDYKISSQEKITVYAFANWETCENNELNAIISKEKGDTISESDLAIEISDPASLVDIENKNYIPMSGIKQFSFSELRENTETVIELELVRLVGKVTIDINDLEDDTLDWEVTLMRLTFSSTANSVLLFNDYKPTDYSESRLKTIAILLDDDEANDNTHIAEFYVNETNGDEGFEVTLSVEEKSGEQGENGGSVDYGPVTTKRTTIPRNSVYPLILSFDPIGARLTVSAYTSIIGVDGELLYDLSSIQDYILAEDSGVFYTGKYSISLYDITSKYTLLPTLWNLGTNEKIDNVTWDWEWKNQDTSISGELDVDDDTNALTMAQLTATPDYTYEYSLKATWGNTSDGIHQRSYNINVTFIDSDDMPKILTRLSSRAWRTRNLDSEILRMTKR